MYGKDKNGDSSVASAVTVLFLLEGPWLMYVRS